MICCVLDVHCVGHTPFRLWPGDGIISIDCGCGNRKAAHRRLACL